MIKLTIDDRSVEVPDGTTVLQAAQHLGIEIPVFCYHPRLAIAGNCRMCLVEIDKSPKPVASCAFPVSEGMIVRTTTDMTRKARKGVLEFLLINHPLDCPICDQGGECDLQDLTVAYGPSTSRFQENKRTLPEKYLGPLIKTYMNRCIHCTRCIRFASDVAGVPEMGVIGRGEDMEITNYLDHVIGSELSGNLVDICPVGALTSRPYAFKGRPWDLVKTETIDVMDAVGSHIRIDTYGMKVIRVLPRLCEDINEEWISDKIRHACDGLSQQRLDRPYVRRNNKLEPASWTEAFEVIQKKVSELKGQQLAALAGDMADVEAMLCLKNLMHSLGSPHLDCRQGGEANHPSIRASYLFNTTIAGIEQADACLIIDSAIRQEAPIIHARLQKRYLQGHFSVGYIGGELPKEKGFTFKVDHLGNNPKLLDQILNGTHPFSSVLTQAKRPMIIVGQSALRRTDGEIILKKVQDIADRYQVMTIDWNGFNVLQQAASRVGGLDIGFTPASKGQSTRNILKACQSGEIKLIYLLGVDEIESNAYGDAFVIYQGHHGDRGANRADVILPGAAYSEKEATYVNTEGRVQSTLQALFPPGEAKEDWRILHALSAHLGKPLPYKTLEEVRNEMIRVNPVFGDQYQCTSAPWVPFKIQEDVQEDPSPFDPHIFNFFTTDPISRSSQTMALCALEQSIPTLKEKRVHG